MSIEFGKVFGVAQWRAPTQVSQRRFGVPIGGPWDCESALIANALVGNDRTAPVFELLQGSVELTVTKPGTVCILALRGSIRFNEEARTPSCRVAVQPGDRVSLAAQLAYVSFSEKPLANARLDSKMEPPSRLRFLPAQEISAAMELQVSRTSNRAGTRLIGLPAAAFPELPSEPSCVGAIQRTPSGELIMIGPDGPTIGGYPRIGTIIESDLDKVARLEPSQTVTLEPIAFGEAIELNAMSDSALKQRLSLIHTTLG